VRGETLNAWEHETAVRVLQLDSATDDAFDVLALRHPETGEPFTSATFRREVDSYQVHWAPPLKPQEWMLEGEEEEAMSEEDFAKAMSYYEQRLAEWKRTGGVAYVKGQPFEFMAATTASGATAHYIRSPGGAWQCQSWATAELVINQSS
jgi:hypothetical protein